jgi:hypothetical protein
MSSRNLPVMAGRISICHGHITIAHCPSAQRRRPLIVDGKRARQHDSGDECRRAEEEVKNKEIDDPVHFKNGLPLTPGVSATAPV